LHSGVKVGWGGWTRTNTVLINSGNFDVQHVHNVQCVQRIALGGRKLLRAFSLADWTPDWTPLLILLFSKCGAEIDPSRSHGHIFRNDPSALRSSRLSTITPEISSRSHGKRHTG